MHDADNQINAKLTLQYYDDNAVEGTFNIPKSAKMQLYPAMDFLRLHGYPIGINDLTGGQ